jgi:hypothetical protein
MATPAFVAKDVSQRTVDEIANIVRNHRKGSDAVIVSCTGGNWG